MAIAIQGTPSVYENASAQSIITPYPAGIVAGELLLMQVTFSSSTAAPATPSGWTLDKSLTSGSALWTGVYWRIATGSESGSVTLTTTAAAGRVTGIITRYSGVDNTTPIDVATITAVNTSGTTFTMGSQTLVTAGAMVIATLAINASTSTDYVIPSGWTGDSKSTGAGRRTVSASQTFASAGATGSTVWSQTGATALQMLGIHTALRPSASTGPSGSLALSASGTLGLSGVASIPPVLNHYHQGIPGPTSAVFKVNTSNATSVRMKLGTDSGVTAGVVYSSAGTPDSNGNTELTVTGLSPNTRYYCRVAMTNGTESLDNWSTPGEIVTPVSSGQMNFSFAFGSCCSQPDSDSMAAIAVKKPNMLFHIGDEYYADASGTTTANFRAKMTAKREVANHKQALRVIPAAYTPSDHDGMNNNTNAGSDPTAWTNWNAVWREFNPSTGLPGSTGVYRTFTYGRVRFIVLDRRSFATAPTATDDAAKTCLGATQKQWLKDTITASTEAAICIVQADPWIGAASAGDDGWFGYTTERTELANFFSASGKNIVMLGGDMHALAAEDGSSSPGGVAIFQASPWNTASSIKGGPYDVGPYPASGTATVQQYGWMDVTDTGSNISFAYTGYSSDNTQRVALTKSFTLTVAYSGTLNLSASGTLTEAGTPAPAASLPLSATGTLSRAATVGLAGSLGLSAAGTLALAGGQAAVGNLALSGTGTLTGAGNPAVNGSRGLGAVGSLGLSTTSAFSGSVGLSGAGTLALARGLMTGSAGCSLSASGTLDRAVGAVNITDVLQFTAVGELLRIPGQSSLMASLALSAIGVLSGQSNNTFSGTVFLSGSGQVGANNPTPGPRTTIGLTASGTNVPAQTYMVQQGGTSLSGAGTLSGNSASMGVTDESVDAIANTTTDLTRGQMSVARSLPLTGAGTLGLLATFLSQSGSINRLAIGTQFRSAVGEAIGSIDFHSTGTLACDARDPGLKQTLARTGSGTLTAGIAGLSISSGCALSGSGSLTGVGTVLGNLFLEAGTDLFTDHSGQSNRGTVQLDGSGDLSFAAMVLGNLVLQGGGQLAHTPGKVTLAGDCLLSTAGLLTRVFPKPTFRPSLPLSGSGGLSRLPVSAGTKGSVQRSAVGLLERQQAGMGAAGSLARTATGLQVRVFIPQSEVGSLNLTGGGTLGLLYHEGVLNLVILPSRYYFQIRKGRP